MRKRDPTYVIGRFSKRAKRSLYWFIQSAVFVGGPLFTILWSRSIEMFSSFGLDPALPPLFIAVVGLSILILQILCIHEDIHHSSYPAPSSMRRVRLGFVIFAPVLAFTLLSPVLTNTEENLMLPFPYNSAFTAVSALSVALTVEYFSKVWYDYRSDYFPSPKEVFIVLSIAIVIIFLVLFPAIGSMFSIYERIALVITSIATGSILYIWFSLHYQLWSSQKTPNGSRSKSGVYQLFNRSRTFPLVGGVLTGFGLPMAFAIRRLQDLRTDLGQTDIVIVFLSGLFGVISYLLIIAIFFATISTVYIIVTKVEGVVYSISE